MDVTNFNNFAQFWQQLVSTAKVGFMSKCVTATSNFKKSYKIRTGNEFNTADTVLSATPIAIEPIVSKCKTPAIGCYIFMPNGHVYEGIIRTDPSATKGVVHLVWFCADDASKRPAIQLDNMLFKKCSLEKGGDASEE